MQVAAADFGFVPVISAGALYGALSDITGTSVSLGLLLPRLHADRGAVRRGIRLDTSWVPRNRADFARLPRHHTLCNAGAEHLLDRPRQGLSVCRSRRRDFSSVWIQFSLLLPTRLTVVTYLPLEILCLDKCRDSQRLRILRNAQSTDAFHTPLVLKWLEKKGCFFLCVGGALPT